jgi:hypothetical protein
VQRFLYLNETGSLSVTDTHDNASIDDFVFTNICELQSRNIQLAEEVERLRSEQEKAIENYHNSEFVLFLIP